jgi:hypothetical protein
VAKCWRAAGASKIAPHKLHALFELGVAVLDVFDVFGHGYIVHRKMKNRKLKMGIPVHLASRRWLCGWASSLRSE